MTSMIFTQIDNEDFCKSLNLTRGRGECFTLESEWGNDANDAPERIDVLAPDGLPGFTVEAGGAGPREPLTPGEYLAIMEVAGLHDTGSTVDDERVKAEAHRAARAILDEPITEMGLHRGFGTVAVWRAQAVLRSYGVPPVECTIGEVVYEPRRSLLQDGRAGHLLLETLRAQAEQARLRAEAERFARDAATRVNTRTLGQLGMEAIFIPKTTQVGPSGDLGEANPFPIIADDEGIVYAYRQVAGWEAPFAPIGSGRFLERDYVPRVLDTMLSAAPDPNKELLGWILSARDAAGIGDRGPVDFGLRDTVASLLGGRERRARELAAYWAPRVFHSSVTAGHPYWWRRSWVVEAMVRGFRVRPELAASILSAAVEEVLEAERVFVVPAAVTNSPEGLTGDRIKRWIRKNPKTVRRWIPAPLYPFDRAEADRACLAAARAGRMAPGALLDEPTPPPPKRPGSAVAEKRAA